MYIGIDGGGTKTRAVLVNDSDVVARAVAGPSNVLVAGEQRAFEAVSQVWHELLKHVQGNVLEGTVLGLAGIDRSFIRDNWIRRLDQFIVGHYWLVGDYQLAWAAMTNGAPGPKKQDWGGMDGSWGMLGQAFYWVRRQLKPPCWPLTGSRKTQC